MTSSVFSFLASLRAPRFAVFTLVFSLFGSIAYPEKTEAGEASGDQSPRVLLQWDVASGHLSGSASEGAKALRCPCKAEKTKSGSSSPCPAKLCGVSVVIDGGSVAKTICQAVAKSREFSLLVTVSEAKAEQHGPARIVSFSSDHSARNFTLGQEGGSFDLRVLTRDSDANGSQKNSTFGKVESKQARQVLIACRGKTASCYVDGKLVKEIPLAGAIGEWSDRHKIVFGDELTGKRDWSGTLHRVAIFDRALKPPEAKVLMDRRGGAKKTAARKPSTADEAAPTKTKSAPLPEVVVQPKTKSKTKSKAEANGREKALAEGRARMVTHEKGHAESAEFDRRQAAALSGLRADVSSLHAELEALRRDGKVLTEQLASSEKHRLQVQRELAELLKQRNSGPSDVAEVSKQFAAAMKQLSETSQARLIEQQRRFEAEAQRYRSENERTRAEVQQMRQHFEKQVAELHAALEAAHRAKAKAEAEAKAAAEKARAAEKRIPKKQAAVPDKVTSVDKPLRLSILRFDKNIAVAEQDQRRALEEVKEILARNPGARFEIVGHTCSDGRSQVNRYLSNLRASNVRDFLVAHGVPAETLEFRGVGEAQPVADNATLEGRKLNRRVEILRTK